MPLFCNGFNLFRQLNVNKPILEEFVKVFEFEVIKQVWINYSYILISTDTDYLIFHKEGVCNLTSLIPKQTVLITTNDDQVICLNRSGKLFKICLADNFSNIQELCSLDYVESSNNSFVNIRSSSKLIVTHLADGTVYNVLEKLKFTCNSVIDIQCGKEHCLLLDETGNLYSFGKGSHGQLGHGKLDDEIEPKLVEALAGIKIKKIAAGNWHSCAISQDGDLYVWGWNSNGQLGLGIEEDDKKFVSVMASPHVVDFDDEELNAVLVACGSRHTIVFFDNKQLYGCGWNKYHQLTKFAQENYYKLTYLHDFKNMDVIHLQCGPWNSAVRCK